MKAEVLVRDSLQEIGQQAAEQPVQPDELATGIRYFNRLMRGYAWLGLGFTTLVSGSDEVTIPAFAEDWAVCLLAKRLSTQFPSLPDSDKVTLDANLKEAWNNMMLQVDVSLEQSYSYTLPVGSGNENRLFIDRFYPEDDDNILQEDGNDILLES